MLATQSKLTLNNGVELHALGFGVFDFALCGEDIAAIDALDTGLRGGPNQDEVDFLTFNRPIPE